MLKFYDREFTSRLLVGTALYPSPAIMQSAIRASAAEIVTVSLRRPKWGTVSEILRHDGHRWLWVPAFAGMTWGEHL